MSIEKWCLRLPIYGAGLYTIQDLANIYDWDILLMFVILLIYSLCIETLSYLGYKSETKVKPKELNNSHVMDSLHLEDHHLEAESKDIEQQEVYTINHINNSNPFKPPPL